MTSFRWTQIKSAKPLNIPRVDAVPITARATNKDDFSSTETPATSKLPTQATEKGNLRKPLTKWLPAILKREQGDSLADNYGDSGEPAKRQRLCALSPERQWERLLNGVCKPRAAVDAGRHFDDHTSRGWQSSLGNQQARGQNWVRIFGHAPCCQSVGVFPHRGVCIFWHFGGR